MLVSTLPEELRVSSILAPSKTYSADGEAAYVALYTTLIAIITLSGGELSEARFRRHLARFNAADNMPSLDPNYSSAPSEKTEAVLQRMIRQGYLVKVVETTGDDESTTWYVGPRGKVEVNNEAIAAFVRGVYGGDNDDNDDGGDELEKKLAVSLKVKERKPAPIEEEEADNEDQHEANGDPGPSSRRSRRTRHSTAQEEEREQEEEDDDE
jgi:melanoma-associated antigen